MCRFLRERNRGNAHLQLFIQVYQIWGSFPRFWAIDAHFSRQVLTCQGKSSSLFGALTTWSVFCASPTARHVLSTTERVLKVLGAAGHAHEDTALAFSNRLGADGTAARSANRTRRPVHGGVPVPPGVGLRRWANHKACVCSDQSEARPRAV